MWYSGKRLKCLCPDGCGDFLVIFNNGTNSGKECDVEQEIFHHFRHFDTSSEYTRVVVKQYRQIPPLNRTLCVCVKIVIFYYLDNSSPSLTEKDIRICCGDRDDQLHTAAYSSGAVDDIDHEEFDVCYKISSS